MPLPTGQRWAAMTPPMRANRAMLPAGGEFTRGDPAVAMAQAHVAIERTFELSAVHQSPLEPHGCAVQVDPYNEQVTVWSSTQGTFMVRQQVAEILGLTDSDVRCFGTPVGGGFGAKGRALRPVDCAYREKSRSPGAFGFDSL